MVDIEKEANEWYKLQKFDNGTKPLTIMKKPWDSVKCTLLYPDSVSVNRWIDSAYQLMCSTWTNRLIDDVSNERKFEVVKNVIERSSATVPLESLTLTFAMEGVSRQYTHQAVRHRAMGFGQESLRITDMRMHEISLPESIQKSDFYEDYTRECLKIKELYTRMVDGGIPMEDARALMPMGSITYLVQTGNLRAWLGVWHSRSNEYVQSEHRIVTYRQVKEIKQKIPMLYELIKNKIPEVVE